MAAENLLEIPTEILSLVFKHLDTELLRVSALVCKYFNALSEPWLYRDIIILRGSHGFALANAFLANPERTKWVRSLLVSTKFGDDDGLHSLPPWILQMDNLRDLRLETPDCNLKAPEERIDWLRLQDRYERVFGQASVLVPKNERCLPNLQSCTVHLVDEEREMITLKRHHALFLHPNLRSLTISCASTDFVHNLPETLTRDLSLTRSTKLEHLHLEECDINAHSLKKLLRLSQDLQSLKISEGTRYDHGMFSRQGRKHGNVAPDALVEAMTKYCSKSLTKLSLALGHVRQGGHSINQRGQHLNLTLFDNLKSLELNLLTCSLIRINGGCDHATSRRLPSSLEELKVFGIPLSPRHRPFRALNVPYFPLNLCFVREKAAHGVPNLKTITYSYAYLDADERSSLATSNESIDSVDSVPQVPLAQNRIVQECIKQLPLFEKAQVRLRIVMVQLPQGYIPPFLFPEESPSSYLLWDSISESEHGSGSAASPKSDTMMQIST